MFKHWLFAALIVLGSVPALADECLWVDKDVAQKAVPLINGRVLQQYCPNCGEKHATQLSAGKVTAGPVQDQAPYWHVLLDANELDLAYIYVQQSSGGDWLNVGLLANCTDDDQARVLPHDVIAAAGSAPAGPAASVGGCTKPVFTADFGKADPNWSSDDDTSLTIGGGRLQLKAAAGDRHGAYYDSSTFDGDGEICVNVPVSPVKDLDDANGGVYFWQVDDDNYYLLLISADGQAEITRAQKGKESELVDWRTAPSLKSGADAVNAIRIGLKGDAISVYINDTLFYQGNGTQIKGYHIGFVAESATCTYTDLKIE